MRVRRIFSHKEITTLREIASPVSRCDNDEGEEDEEEEQKEEEQEEEEEEEEPVWTSPRGPEPCRCRKDASIRGAEPRKALRQAGLRCSFRAILPVAQT